MEKILVKTAGLLLAVALGYVLKRRGVFRTEDARILSRIIIYLTLPGALIASFASFQASGSLLLLPLIAAAANVALLAVGAWISRGRDKATRALYLLNTPSYNIGTFVLPFVQSFLPAAGLVAVSMFDAGNCPMNSGGAYAVAASMLDGSRVRPSFVLKKMAASVPFMTFLVMLCVSLLRIPLPGEVYTVAGMFGQANAFLAMLMIGVMFEPRMERADSADVLRIVAVRYGFGAAAAAVCYFLLPLPLVARQVAVLSLLAPVPSVTLAYCEKCGCKGAVVSAVHSLCIPVSLVCLLGLMLLWS